MNDDERVTITLSVHPGDIPRMKKSLEASAQKAFVYYAKGQKQRWLSIATRFTDYVRQLSDQERS